MPRVIKVCAISHINSGHIGISVKKSPAGAGHKGSCRKYTVILGSADYHCSAGTISISTRSVPASVAGMFDAVSRSSFFS